MNHLCDVSETVLAPAVDFSSWYSLSYVESFLVEGDGRMYGRCSRLHIRINIEMRNRKIGMQRCLV